MATDDDEGEQEERPVPPRRKPSTIPSWVMVGFVFGAWFAWMLPRQGEAPAPPPAPPAPQVPTAPPRLAMAEAMFQRWAQHAVWDRDSTEIAVWNAEVGDFADFFEVRRVRAGEDGEYTYYFRTLPELTRPVFASPDIPADALVRFTESTEASIRRRNERVGRQLIDVLRGPRPAGGPESAPAVPAGK